MKFDESRNIISQLQISTWPQENSRSKCYIPDPSSDLTIKGLPDSIDFLEVSLNYQWEIFEANAIAYEWDFGNGTQSNQKTVIFNANKVEENRTICATANILGWFNRKKCFQIYVRKIQVTSRNPNTPVIFSSKVEISEDDEVVWERNYGKLIKIGTQLWLQKDQSANMTNWTYDCPTGFR